jgi:hypothetical protein
MLIQISPAKRPRTTSLALRRHPFRNRFCQLAAVALFQAASLSCSSQGEPGPPGQQGDRGESGSPDEPEAVLEKLSTVDGDGSGLDADTLDGLEASEFARAGARTVQFFRNGDTMFDTGGNPTISEVIQIPRDIVANAPLHVALLFILQDGGTPCEMSIVPALNVLPLDGGKINRIEGTYEGGETTLLVPDDSYHEARFEITPDEDSGVDAGKWASIQLTKQSADACTSNVTVVGMALEYQAQ